MQRDNFEEIMDYMKNTVPQIDATTLDKVMRDVFTTDIQKQLTEYQVEYNVLQEEISTTQHYMESLNREKESYSQIESKLQVNPPHAQANFIRSLNKEFHFFSLPNRVSHNWRRPVHRNNRKFNRFKCKCKVWRRPSKLWVNSC